VKSSNVKVKKSEVNQLLHIFTIQGLKGIFDIFDTPVTYSYSTRLKYPVFSFCFPSYKSMREAIIQKIRNSILPEEKKLIVIYLFLSETMFFNRFQVT